MNQETTEHVSHDNLRLVIPISRPVWKLMGDLLLVVSLTNLCLVNVWFPTLYDFQKGYFNQVPVTSGMLLLLVGELFCFAFVTFVGMRGLQTRGWRLVLHLVFFGLLLLPFDFVRVHALSVPDYQIVSFLKRPIGAGGLLLAGAFVIWRHELVARVFGFLIAVLSPLALMTLVRIAFLLIGVQHLASQSESATEAPLSPVDSRQPRVLWILFDETDERLAFERRPAKVKLPEFDRLRSEALFATRAVPPGDSTFMSVPALISGRVFSTVTVKDSADLNVTMADGGAAGLLSEQPSVFAAARGLGVNSAVVGWYHPYGRLFGASLNYCKWHPFPSYEPERGKTLGQTFLRQLGCVTGTVHIRGLYGEICRVMLSEALEAVTNKDYGLVFLHLPPPHKPGIYLPQRDKLTIWGMPKVDGYFNNLALADHCLGALRHAMVAEGLWDRTWVIISSDHSWRESRVYDGQRDLRVPFLIKTPRENQGFTYSSEVQTVITRDLILSIFRGEISDQAQTIAWLDRRKSAGQSVFDHVESTGKYPGIAPQNP